MGSNIRKPRTAPPRSTPRRQGTACTYTSAGGLHGHPGSVLCFHGRRAGSVLCAAVRSNDASVAQVVDFQSEHVRVGCFWCFFGGCGGSSQAHGEQPTNQCRRGTELLVPPPRVDRSWTPITTPALTQRRRGRRRVRSLLNHPAVMLPNKTKMILRPCRDIARVTRPSPFFLKNKLWWGGEEEEVQFTSVTRPA